MRFISGHNGRSTPHDFVEDPETNCWVWSRNRVRGGYGMAHHGGRGVLAHRLYYELHVGPIPAGLHLDHLCRNRACVNPGHVEPVTNAENSRRGANAKLTAREVAAIRAHRPTARFYGRAELAALYGVSEETIQEIRNERTWVGV